MPSPAYYFSPRCKQYTYTHTSPPEQASPSEAPGSQRLAHMGPGGRGRAEVGAPVSWRGSRYTVSTRYATMCMLIRVSANQNILTIILHVDVGISYACVPSVVSCSSFRLPMHASPSRLFVANLQMSYRRDGSPHLSMSVKTHNIWIQLTATATCTWTVNTVQTATFRRH